MLYEGRIEDLPTWKDFMDADFRKAVLEAEVIIAVNTEDGSEEVFYGSEGIEFAHGMGISSGAKVLFIAVDYADVARDWDLVASGIWKLRNWCDVYSGDEGWICFACNCGAAGRCSFMNADDGGICAVWCARTSLIDLAT